MSTQPTDFSLPNLPLSAPLQAEPDRDRGVYSWWLDTARFPTPEALGLLRLPEVPRLVQASGAAELFYVGRARRNLHQCISGRNLRRTRSSALRRTLLAVLLPGDPSWREVAALHGRGRVVLDGEQERRLTEWMQEHLILGWARLRNDGQDRRPGAGLDPCAPTGAEHRRHRAWGRVDRAEAGVPGGTGQTFLACPQVLRTGRWLPATDHL